MARNEVVAEDHLREVQVLRRCHLLASGRDDAGGFGPAVANRCPGLVQGQVEDVVGRPEHASRDQPLPEREERAAEQLVPVGVAEAHLLPQAAEGGRAPEQPAQHALLDPARLRLDVVPAERRVGRGGVRVEDHPHDDVGLLAPARRREVVAVLAEVRRSAR